MDVVFMQLRCSHWVASLPNHSFCFKDGHPLSQTGFSPGILEMGLGESKLNNVGVAIFNHGNWENDKAD